MEAAPSVSAAVAPGPAQDQPRRELQSPATATGTTPVPAPGPGVTPYAPAGPDGLAAPTQHPAPASLLKTASEASSYHPVDPVATPTRPGAISLTAKPSAAVTPYSPAAPVAAGGSSGPPSATNLADSTPVASSYHPLAAAAPPAQTEMTPSLAKSPVVHVVYRQKPMKPEAAASMSVAAAPPGTPEEPRRDLRLPAAVPVPQGAVAPRPAIIPATAVAAANSVPRGGSTRADSAKAVPPAQPGTPYYRGLVVIVQQSKYPSQREWAAKTLAEIDWPSKDAAVGALLDAVREDPSASVRAMCIRCLAQKNVQSAPVRHLLQQLKTDLSAGNDPRVQYEAAQALAHLDGSGAAPSVPAGPTTEAP
jgi:HEAT repeat protein